MKIRNIIFDLGGVLLNIDYHATIDAFKNLGVSNFDRLYTQATQDHVFDHFDKGEISPEEFRNKIRRLAGLPLTNESIDQAWNAMLLDLPWQRIDLLDGVRSNYRTFLLSNTNAIHFPVFREYLHKAYGFDSLDAFFEKQYLSHEIGMHKPDREPFDLIIRENDLEPSQTLFIDDSRQHLDGARAAGMYAFWLDTSAMQVTDLFDQNYLLRPDLLEGGGAVY